MKLPSAAHPITVEKLGKPLTVTFKGEVVAHSNAALVLQESSYPPVYYIPRADIVAAHYRRTERSTHCPYKGDASYFSLIAHGEADENAVWSYETPYPAVAQIEEHVAFYPDRVSFQVAGS
ncbi:DUF427 domain-containing protein [Pseudomonas sp. dw_358]|uniref:DUF427 domain-containing protein n=1 Tax=Pseudomonas sp. dw_358 TaxID=2720083 RepID=UPI001BD34B22|nr:DUF427 domain-containing protein [Pseudomonas sp. dw_358]